MDDLLAGKPVTKFYNVGNEHSPILESSDKYKQAMEIVTAYRIEKGFITPEEIQEHNAKVAKEHEAATVATPQPVTEPVVEQPVPTTEPVVSETPKQVNSDKEDYNLLRKKHFSHQMIETLTPQEREEIFKSFADPNVTDLTPTDILNRREAVKKAQEANEKKAKEKSYEKLTEVLVAEAKELKDRVGYEEFMDKIKGYKTDSYDIKALEEVLEVKRQEYKDQEYAEKQVTFDKIKTGDLVYLHDKKAKGKMYVIIKDEKNNSFKYHLKGTSPKTATTEFPAEDTPRIIAKTASMEETTIEPVTPEAKAAANENITAAPVTQQDEDKALAEAKTLNPMASLKNTKKLKGC